jgi:hypothetical protein
LGRGKMTDKVFLLWLRDRLVHVYNENPNVDFVARLEEIALKQREEVIPPPPPKRRNEPSLGTADIEKDLPSRFYREEEPQPTQAVPRMVWKIETRIEHAKRTGHQRYVYDHTVFEGMSRWAASIVECIACNQEVIETERS